VTSSKGARPGCDLELLEEDGPTHAYLGASAACWRIYGEVLAREYEDLNYWRAHQYTAHAYAAQHPGKPNPQTIQSINVHLVALYLLLEKELEPHQVAKPMAQLAKIKAQLEWLEPPDSRGELTIREVHAAQESAQHLDLTQRWAKSVWQAWKHQHTAIRSLAARLF
jgi:hypothetical protein